LERRVNKKFPLFAEQFVSEEIARKPDYYDGITDAEIQKRHDDVIAAEWLRYLALISRPDQVIVYADEPKPI